MPERYPYPANPPICQDRSSEQFATACSDCPFGPACGYLALSQAFAVERHERSQAHDALITENQDGVVPGFYNLAGVAAIIDRDRALAEDLDTGRAGLIKIDIRGVKGANDEWGDIYGDIILRTAGLRLLDEGIRIHADLVSHEQRHNWYPGKSDIACRIGRSDELYVLLRDVNELQLLEIVERAYNRFSVSRAMQDASAGHLPIPGNVSYVHASRVASPKDERTKSLQERAKAAFLSMRQVGANPFGSSKDDQYNEMWGIVEARRDDVLARPRDHREIYLPFVRSLVPNIDEVMERARGGS